MRNDITLSDVKKCKQELLEVFTSMIDPTILQEAYNTFRKKTGLTIDSFQVPVIICDRPTDRYIGETAIIGEPQLEYEWRIYVL